MGVRPDTVEIQWPGGQVDQLSNVNARQTVTIEKGKGTFACVPRPKVSTRSLCSARGNRANIRFEIKGL
jgi:hypothetical protein